jgi:CheY-like chemotaxis protein
MSKKILIVDDQEDIRSLLKESFEGSGYETFLAEDGVRALELYKENNIDVILSDIKMPNLDGIELSKSVKSINKSTPIFLITAFSDYTENDVKAIGVEAIIFKPFDMSEIVEIINLKMNGVECEA